MNIKQKLNQAIGMLGYSVVRKETLSRLTDVAVRLPIEVEPSQTNPVVEVPAAAVPIPVSALDLNRQPRADRRVKPMANAAPKVSTALAPKFDAASAPCRFTREIEEFQARGITTIATDRALAESWRHSQSFEQGVGNLHSAWDWAGNEVAPYSNALRTGIPSESMREELRGLLSGAAYETFFKGVLGCAVTVANCRLVRSLPNPSPGVGPQEWHGDGCPPGVIRGVLYLTDVDDDSGPFQYKDDTGEVHSVLGNVGDLLIFDANRLLHRGSPPRRSVRMAVDLVFMPRQPGTELKVVAAGMNHWPADPFFYSAPVDRTNLRGQAIT